MTESHGLEVSDAKRQVIRDFFIEERDGLFDYTPPEDEGSAEGMLEFNDTAFNTLESATSVAAAINAKLPAGAELVTATEVAVVAEECMTEEEPEDEKLG